MMRHLLFTAVFSLSVTGIAQAQSVFKWTDSEGVVHFSDKPATGSKSEKLEIKPTRAISSNAKSTREEGLENGDNTLNSSFKEKRLTPKKNSTQADTRYSSLSILTPKNETSTRANNGEVQLRCNASPRLDSDNNHQFRFFLDGQALAQTSTACSVNFRQVERGSHSVYVEIINNEAQTLIRSKTHNFQVQRFSAL